MATNTGAKDPAVSRERFRFVELLSKRIQNKRSPLEIVHLNDSRDSYESLPIGKIIVLVCRKLTTHASEIKGNATFSYLIQLT